MKRLLATLAAGIVLGTVATAGAVTNATSRFFYFRSGDSAYYKGLGCTASSGFACVGGNNYSVVYTSRHVYVFSTGGRLVWSGNN